MLNKGDYIFMDKKEALYQMIMIIDETKDSGPFKGRAKLLSSLNGLYDLVNDYKTTKGFYEYIIKEANLLVETTREKLNNGK